MLSTTLLEILHVSLHWNVNTLSLSCNVLQIAIHAIGDQAVEDVLTWYDAARNYTDRNSSNSERQQSRHRIEHAQHVAGAETIRKFGQQQTVAVVNPLHLLSDMYIMEDRLGKTRSGSSRAFAYLNMLEVCAPLLEAPAILTNRKARMLRLVHKSVCSRCQLESTALSR